VRRVSARYRTYFRSRPGAALRNGRASRSPDTSGLGGARQVGFAPEPPTGPEGTLRWRPLGDFACRCVRTCPFAACRILRWDVPAWWGARPSSRRRREGSFKEGNFARPDHPCTAAASRSPVQELNVLELSEWHRTAAHSSSADGPHISGCFGSTGTSHLVKGASSALICFLTDPGELHPKVRLHIYRRACAG
jgi:hypothetical protein